jgi:hypothetical protein
MGCGVPALVLLCFDSHNLIFTKYRCKKLFVGLVSATAVGNAIKSVPAGSSLFIVDSRIMRSAYWVQPD